MDPILVQLAYSPWSEKARWPLDHHRVRYHAVEHLPLVYEPLLRLASRKPLEKPTVPCLYVGARVIGDSLEIARYAESVGSGSPLFPDDRTREILDWVRRSEELLGAGRARLLDRMLASPAALHEALPGPLKAFGSLGLGVARAATTFLKTKHVEAEESSASLEASMAKVLEAARKSLEGKEYLLGELTFADVAMAASLVVIKLRPDSPLGPEQRKVWDEPRLAAAFPDLLQWRDRMYASHR